MFLGKQLVIFNIPPSSSHFAFFSNWWAMTKLLVEHKLWTTQFSTVNTLLFAHEENGAHSAC